MNLLFGKGSLNGEIVVGGVLYKEDAFWLLLCCVMINVEMEGGCLGCFHY